MTTIAVTRRHVAWDSQLTVNDDEKLASPDDKVIARDGIIYALAGDVIDVDNLIDYLADPKSKPPRGGWEALIIRRGRISFMNAASPYLVTVKAPIALGSGAKFARGAMLAGASAADAVKIAAECDPQTGGPIYYMTISDITGRARKCR
jgi:ATP-dependent protease HslVU (ClpYQ) peptidase subunit